MAKDHRGSRSGEIYTVTVNPCLDVTLVLEEAHRHLEDGTYRVKASDAIVRPGGKGVDVSRALGCLHVHSKALGFVGGPRGATVLSKLMQSGVACDFIEVDEAETRENRIITLRDEGVLHTEIRVNAEGKEIPDLKLLEFYRKCNDIKDARVFAICGSLPVNMPDTVFTTVIRSVRRNEGCLFLLDCPAEPTAATIEDQDHGVEFIKPNLDEYNKLLMSLGEEPLLDAKESKTQPREAYLEYKYTGVSAFLKAKPPDELLLTVESLRSNWRRLLDSLVKMRKERSVSVLLSLGPLGCVSVDRKFEVIHAYYPGPVKGILTRVGAGDSFVAGFLKVYLDDASLEAALKSGVAAAIARITTADLRPGKYLDVCAYDLWLPKIVSDRYTENRKDQHARFLENVSAELCAFGRVAEGPAPPV